MNLALGSKTGKVTLFEYNRCALNSLVPNAPFAVRFGKKGAGIPVECTTIDRFCEFDGITHIDILKIYTEGGDLDVLMGSKGMPEREAIRFIYFEFYVLWESSGTSGGALVPIHDLLTNYGLKFISTYADYVKAEGSVFAVCNALYALPPKYLS